MSTEALLMVLILLVVALAFAGGYCKGRIDEARSKP